MMRLLHSYTKKRYICLFAAVASACFFWAHIVHASTEDIEIVVSNKPVEVALSAPATGIAFTMHDESNVEVQAYEEEKGWSDWKHVNADTHADPLSRTSELLIVDDAERVRVRSDRATSVVVHGIAVSDALVSMEVASAKRKLELSWSDAIPRGAWGADESLRVARAHRRKTPRPGGHEVVGRDVVHNCNVASRLYREEFTEHDRKITNKEGQPLTWPIGKSDRVDTVIIHHTAQSMSKTNKTGPEIMRAIYKFHTLTRGWGDMGYNYVIDREGNIYEGRAGGDFVVGAHALCNNVRSMGVALMGNFQDEQPSKEQLFALRLLIATLSQKYGINPIGDIIRHGKLQPTILAHRDVGQTACAGEHLYALIPQIRTAVKTNDLKRPIFSAYAKASNKNEAALVDYPARVHLTAGERKSFEIKMMNVSGDTWNDETWVLGEAEGLFFTEFVPYSFVAGFMKEKTVGPGETGTFEITVQAPAGATGEPVPVRLIPVINNDRRLMRNIVRLPVETTKGRARMTVVSATFPPLHVSGERVTGTIKLLNSGTVPWDKDTITGIEFELEGGDGEVGILSAPERIGAGEQGTFVVNLLNIHDEGKYTRQIVPKFIGGEKLTASSIEVASNASPLPDISWERANTITFESGEEIATHLLPTVRRKRTVEIEGGHTFEFDSSTSLTLERGQQGVLPFTIVYGEKGVVISEPIANVIAPTNVTIFDPKNRRVRDTLRAWTSELKHTVVRGELTIIAPQLIGTYDIQIGDETVELKVIRSAREEARKAARMPVTRRTTNIANRRNIRLMRRNVRSIEKTRVEIAPTQTRKQANIRVRLSYDTQEAKILSTAPLSIGDESGILTAKGTVYVRRVKDQCEVITGQGTRIGKAVRMMPQSADGITTLMTWAHKDNAFRGTIECRVDPDTNDIYFINELPIEQYMRGIAESGDQEPFEKQRAMAIAARTYALHYVLTGNRKFPGKPYDGNDSPRSFQKYGGANVEKRNDRWVEAVNGTADLVITWQRDIIKPPYHSSNDGRTRSATEIWGWDLTKVPFLDSKPDPWCAGNDNRGHGVGMSGCGSRGQAEEGKTGEQILEYYYKPYDGSQINILPYHHRSLQHNQ